MRINQYLARCGVCSRRGADALINEGKIFINGRPAQLGDNVEASDTVIIDGKRIVLPREHVVLAYYKPVGVTCTEKDAHADRMVCDEIKSDRRVTYAGRLDRDSEGLLIMTDDGDLIDAMMRGKNLHEKEYEVRVDKKINEAVIKRMEAGIYLKDLKTTTRPCRITKTGEKSFNIVLTQGLNRQIRRMCEAEGCKVTSLKRTRVMNIALGNLQVGATRIVSGEELKKLYNDCGLTV